MRVHRHSPVADRRRVDRLATDIPDPVTRLRFLKAVAPRRNRSWRQPALWFCLLVLIICAASPGVLVHAVPPASPRAQAPAPNAEVKVAADVWLVEKTATSETYSNGLRIDNRFLSTTHQRSWLAFPADGSEPVRRSELAGVVFHTTESPQAPFEESENRVLRRIGESLLEYVRRRQAYNFVIDRFGRVYRMVAENEVANHSGHSVWADENWFYINLNESFLGISFEAASPVAESFADLGPAQVRSAAMLVEMLRHSHRIPASNFVTHAQVSVNPSNMQVGLHVDWASGFPFEAIGLSDNNAAPLPSLWAYGFDCDANFTSRVGAPMLAGIGDAEAILRQGAFAAGLSPAAYKNKLRRGYREMLSQVAQDR